MTILLPNKFLLLWKNLYNIYLHTYVNTQASKYPNLKLKIYQFLFSKSGLDSIFIWILSYKSD